MDMKINIRRLQKLMCLALALVLLLTTVGCTAPASTAPSQSQVESTSTTTTVPPTQTTVTTQFPTVNLDELTPEPLEYILTQEDVDQFYVLLEETEKLAIAGENLEELETVSDTMDEQYEYLDAQCSIAFVLSCADIHDEELEQQYLDCVDICTEAYDAYIQMAQRVYLSDTPAKDMLFEDWTEEEIEHMLAYREEVSELQKRNALIEVEYRSNTNDNFRTPLYIELVQNNNKIAQIYGYDNYYTYAYEWVYDRDYSVEELSLMRQYGKEYLTTAFESARINFYNSFYSMDESKQNRVIDFLYSDYTLNKKNYVEAYLDVLPENMAYLIRYMLKMDSTFHTSKNAKAGAFTTTIGDRSYCYFGPGYASSNTIIHEAGHYYASRYADLGSIPLDLAETQSQGNEWLFTHFLKDQMNATEYKGLVDYLLFNNMNMILLCLMVDEFESQVYTTDISGYTAKDFDALMNAVATQYFDLGYIQRNMGDINAYWREVVVEQPVYYISYGVSVISSIDLYTMALEDFEGAIATYQNICENPQEGMGFQDTITAAGLIGPFQEEFYINIVELIQNRK